MKLKCVLLSTHVMIVLHVMCGTSSGTKNKIHMKVVLNPIYENFLYEMFLVYSIRNGKIETVACEDYRLPGLCLMQTHQMVLVLLSLCGQAALQSPLGLAALNSVHAKTMVHVTQ